jgi:acyl-CoA reductase-like NAD-dependent aldehyde dehydrogenase
MWLKLCLRVPSCWLCATDGRDAHAYPHAIAALFPQVTAHVADAVSKGAKLLVGGSVPQLPEPLSGGNFYSPTVLAEATIAM